MPELPEGLSLPPDPFAPGTIPPDMTGLHDFYMSLRAAGFDMTEALILIANIVTATKAKEPEPDEKQQPS